MAYAIGPSVNSITQLIFPSKTSLYNSAKFPMTETNPKIQKLLQLRSKNYETNSIKSDSFKAFQQYLQNNLISKK
jgi:hypothetical protein